jgi:hypothetical protein
MVSQANRLAGSSQSRRFKNSLGISLVAGLVLSALPTGQQSLAYDGPTFSKGMWLFQRSTEFVTKHWVLPNARRVKVEQPVVRCVNPTEAMIETFRPVSVGACQSTLPERKKNTFVFAKRCDYLGPVKTVITVESDAAYRETNELLTGASPKRDIVVARRLGDCGSTPDLNSASLAAKAAEALAPVSSDPEDSEFEASAAKRTGGGTNVPAGARD